MKTSEHTDMVRMASRYTMNGLIDPRLLEKNGKAAPKENFLNRFISLFTNSVVVR